MKNDACPCPPSPSYIHSLLNNSSRPYAVIVTGDSDYVPAVKAAKDAGITVKLCYNEASIHNELFAEVDERYEIDQALIDQAKSS